MVKKEKKEIEIFNYYSNKLAFEKIEDVDILGITIPPDFLDDSKDILESDDEDYVDFENFEDSGEEEEVEEPQALKDLAEFEENLEELGFEGKTQEELEEFIMQRLMNGGETPQKEEPKIEEVEEIEDTPKAQIPIQEIKTLEIKTLESGEIKFETVSSTDANYSSPDTVPMSMFQMSEEETQEVLENAQAEFEKGSIQEEIKEEVIEEIQKEKTSFHDPFDEYEKENSSKKKYVFSINQQYAFAIDEVPVEEREQYIEHAIKLKIEEDNGQRAKHKRVNFFMQLLTIAIAICIGTPIAFMTINWSVDSTIKNYEYCQKSFEQLFKKRYGTEKRKY